MIYEFSLKNFRSYKSNAWIDFTAKPIGSLRKHLLIKYVIRLNYYRKIKET